MVELFTAGCFGRSPGMVDARSSASLRTSSPRRHGLSEVRDLEPPATDYAAVRPVGRRRLTDSNMAARGASPRVCPGRPGPGADRHRIEAADCSRARSHKSLLATASVELDKRVSTHPALRVSDCHRIVGGMMSPASLCPAGEAGLPGIGVCVRTPRRADASSVSTDAAQQTVFAKQCLGDEASAVWLTTQGPVE